MSVGSVNHFAWSCLILRRINKFHWNHEAFTISNDLVAHASTNINLEHDLCLHCLNQLCAHWAESSEWNCFTFNVFTLLKYDTKMLFFLQLTAIDDYCHLFPFKYLEYIHTVPLSPQRLDVNVRHFIFVYCIHSHFHRFILRQHFIACEPERLAIFLFI